MKSYQFICHFKHLVYLKNFGFGVIIFSLFHNFLALSVTKIVRLFENDKIVVTLIVA